MYQQARNQLLENEIVSLRRQGQSLFGAQNALRQRNATLQSKNASLASENASLRSQLESLTSGKETVCQLKNPDGCRIVH
jgi:cell division protein FtsB